MKIVRPTDAIPPRTTIVIIYGDSGTGKTSLAFTAKRPLLLAFEEGVERSFADGRGIFVPVATWQELLVEMDSDNGELVTLIREENIQTLIADTAGTAIQSQITDYVKSLGGKLTTKGGSALSMDGWQHASNEFGKLIKFAKKFNLDLICLAHSKGDGKEQKMDIDVQGSARGILTKHSDIIAYISTDGRGQRWIELDGTEDKVGKNPARIGRQMIPACSTKDKYPTFLENEIISKTKAAMFGQTEQQRKVADLYKSLNEQLNKAEEFSEVAELFGKATTLPTSLQFAFIDGCKKAMKTLYTTKILATVKKATELTTLVKGFRNDTEIPKILQDAVGAAIMSRSKELGFTFSTEKGKFIKADGTEEETPAAEDKVNETANEEATQN